MNEKTTGTVISAAKQWWLKINTKPVRMHAMDGAIFPYIIRVQYAVGDVYKSVRKTQCNSLDNRELHWILCFV